MNIGIGKGGDSEKNCLSKIYRYAWCCLLVWVETRWWELIVFYLFFFSFVE